MNPDRKNNTLPVEMDSINTKETDLLITRTPFYLDTGWELVTENKNTSCSHAQIEQMIQKRTINLIDMEILKILASYHYLNHYHTAYLLEERLHPNYHKTSYLDNLNKLKRAGLVLCYIPARSDKLTGDLPLTPASPLRLYCLSQGAYAYMEPITKDSHALPPTDSLRKMETAAANQFIIHFLHHYKDTASLQEYAKTVRLGTSLLTIDGILRYHASFYKDQSPEPVSLFVLSIRRQENWEKRALARLHLFNVWLSRHETEYLTPFPVLIVENMAMAVSLFSRMQAQDNPSDVFFCPESLLMLYAPLEAIYRCVTDEMGKIKAVRLAIKTKI